MINAKLSKAILCFFLLTSSIVAKTIAAPFYLTGGYSLTHELYRPLWQTISTIQPPFTYNVQNTYPNNLSGLRLGFGGKISSNNPHFGYEIDFNQVFAKYKITPGLKVTRPEKFVLSFIDYRINPTSRLEWLLAAGAVINTVFVTTETFFPNQPSKSTTTTTTVDPMVGVLLEYHINPKLAVKGIFCYKNSAYNPSVYGSLIPLLMLNYYPNV